MQLSTHGTDANGRETVSIKRAGEMTSVSRRTIYNWMRQDKIDFTRTASGSVRIYVDSLFRPDRPPVLRGGAAQAGHGNGNAA
jgi:hypothetical protein